jgi:16S rRNA (guanine527-N7)-methyltransferase
MAERAVDNKADDALLREGLAALGEELPPDAVGALLAFRDELLRWNARVNLTAVTEPREVLEKHFVDSLAILPEVRGGSTLLDLGAGAGFPGIPLKIALPALTATLVDSAGKKVAFMKSVIARLGLEGIRVLQARVGGSAQREGLDPADVVVSRALMDAERWVPLAEKYVGPGGRVVAMMGRPPAEGDLAEAARAVGMSLLSFRTYRLPWSHAERSVATFGR